MTSLARTTPAIAANQIDIIGPSGSGAFGTNIAVLANGNMVVTDPGYDLPSGATDVGAVYLYDGSNGVLISVLTGSTTNDYVGSHGIAVLSNGNYVVCSPFWDNDTVPNAGAVTWGSSSSGVSGVVGSNNSLVGSTANDTVGYRGVTVLSNSNYVVSSPDWDNGTATDAGAATWGSGVNSVSGVINSSNSLVGSAAFDKVGESIVALSNGNYIVESAHWSNGVAQNAGAVTWGDGKQGISGVVGLSNSLVGSTTNDTVGYFGITVLSNSNYVVKSPYWDNGVVRDAGAVTWSSGVSGVSGVVDSNNSLIGSNTDDLVGYDGVLPLNNGNYVVKSSRWSNGMATVAGAVTWGSGLTGISGTVNSSNSLVGSTYGDSIGSRDVIALSNSNYVVSSPDWDNGTATNAGAVTWGSGVNGVSGVVNSNNSLIGSAAFDEIGLHMTALNNGNYVVSSPIWDNGEVTDVGAVTWGDGNKGSNGVVGSSNSLIGNTADDQVGYKGVTALDNGNYVVNSPYWSDGAKRGVGAVTWGNGMISTNNAVSSSNSLVGMTAGDSVGYGGITLLSNDNYVVSSPFWSNGNAKLVGAVTWSSGISGTYGVVSSSNSWIGSTTEDLVGYHSEGVNGITALSNGNYVVSSPHWDNGAVIDVGAVTWTDGRNSSNGVINSSNSLIGNANDLVGDGVTALSNGNYVVISPYWNNGEAKKAGAVTWGNGISGTRGIVDNTNSLVGGTADDRVGDVTPMINGNYFVITPLWDNGPMLDTGAFTWGNGKKGVSGEISINNSVIGVAAHYGNTIEVYFDEHNQQLVVSRPTDSRVTLLKVEIEDSKQVYLPLINKE